MVVLAVRDHDDFEPVPHRGLEVRALAGGLVVDRHVVEDDRDGLVGQEVALAPDDQRSVQPLADAARAVVRADDMVVVVPVTRAARLPGAVLAPARGVGAPGVRPGLARFDDAPVHPGTVAGDVVVDAVRVETGGHVHRVLELDVQGVAFVDLDQRPGNRRLALLEAVAHRAVRQLLGVQLEMADHPSRRGRPGRALRRGGLDRTEGQRCHAGRRRHPAAHQNPPVEAPSVHVELPTVGRVLRRMPRQPRHEPSGCADRAGRRAADTAASGTGHTVARGSSFIHTKDKVRVIAAIAIGESRKEV